jgi:anti-sigma B factor antagonist
MSELETGSDLIKNVRLQESDLLASVHGEIDLHNSPDLRGHLLRLLEQTRPKRLILNLQDVPYMDSSAIAVLVETLQKLRKSGGTVCLTSLQPRVQGLLEIARLETIFTVTATEADALAKR